ncbi:hypothetical protein [Rhizobium laguerreae]|uniref:hypothetical protein n=1 Tax=Rhizobium laguerreae TaxID=1076926 RepID=UPI0021B0D81B|nr:hypothetical protein [Rhizobium laguerreae]
MRGDKPVHEAATLSRQAALSMAVAATGRVAHAAPGSDAALLAIIHRTEQQAAAFMAGDMTRWANLIRLDDDFTLMQPFGGSASHGFDDSPEHLAELARFFRNGGGTLEVEKSYVSGDLIVLVMIERQHGEVGSLPDQIGRCASLRSIAGMDRSGGSPTVMPTRWLGRSRWNRPQPWPGANDVCPDLKTIALPWTRLSRQRLFHRFSEIYN